MIPKLMSHFAASCETGGSNFLGFPSWYHYLPCQSVNGVQTPQLNNINDIWLILAALIEILLRIGALAALIFVIVGGAQYMTSQGQPDRTTRARMTIINALIGLVISILAATVVSFIAGQFK